MPLQTVPAQGASQAIKNKTKSTTPCQPSSVWQCLLSCSNQKGLNKRRSLQTGSSGDLRLRRRRRRKAGSTAHLENDVGLSYQTGKTDFNMAWYVVCLPTNNRRAACGCLGSGVTPPLPWWAFSSDGRCRPTNNPWREYTLWDAHSPWLPTQQHSGSNTSAGPNNKTTTCRQFGVTATA